MYARLSSQKGAVKASLSHVNTFMCFVSKGINLQLSVLFVWFCFRLFVGMFIWCPSCRCSYTTEHPYEVLHDLEVGVIVGMYCILYSLMLWRCWLGIRKGIIWPVKRLLLQQSPKLSYLESLLVVGIAIEQAWCPCCWQTSIVKTCRIC